MKNLLRVTASSLLMLPLLSIGAYAQNAHWMPDVTQKQTYTLHRASSKEATGGNTDYRTVNPGETHMWFLPLPPVDQRIPTLQPLTGAGNSGPNGLLATTNR
jgi:hypothetical protein